MPEQPSPGNDPNAPQAPKPGADRDADLSPPDDAGRGLEKYESAGGTRSVVVRPTSGLLRRRGTWAAPIGPSLTPQPEIESSTEPAAPRVSSKSAQAQTPTGRLPRQPQHDAARPSQRVRRSRALKAMPELAEDNAAARPSRRLSGPVIAAEPGGDRSQPLRFLLLAVVLIGLIVAVSLLAPASLEAPGPRLAVGGPPVPPALLRSRVSSIWSAVHQGEDLAALARDLAPLGEDGIDRFIALALRDGDKPTVAARALALMRRLEAPVEFRALCRLMRDSDALGAAAAARASQIDDPALWSLAQSYRSANPRLEALLERRSDR